METDKMQMETLDSVGGMSSCGAHGQFSPGYNSMLWLRGGYHQGLYDPVPPWSVAAPWHYTTHPFEQDTGSSFQETQRAALCDPMSTGFEDPFQKKTVHQEFHLGIHQKPQQVSSTLLPSYSSTNSQHEKANTLMDDSNRTKKQQSVAVEKPVEKATESSNTEDGKKEQLLRKKSVLSKRKIITKLRKGEISEEELEEILIWKVVYGGESRKKKTGLEFECIVCKRNFKSKGKLRRHEDIHLGIKHHSCETCNKSFRDTYDLKKHLRTHTGSRPYQCSRCERAFTQSGDLKRHAVVHTGVSKYRCKVCMKAFSQAQTLEMHARTHSGEKPFRCEVCDRAFNQSSHLKRHGLVHSEVKPYKCAVCHKVYTQKGALRRHEASHI